jgi:hypothetical protein
MKTALVVWSVAILAVASSAEAKKKKSADDLGDVPIVPISVIKLTVQSAVAGASVKVDDKVLGTTPLLGHTGLAIGRHTITVSRPGYADYRSEFSLRAGENKVINADLKMTGALLTIRSSALGGMASVDGVPLGGLPIIEKDLTPGSHTVEVRAPGMEPFTQQVALAVGDVRSVEAILRPAGSPPSLTAVTQSSAQRTVEANAVVEPPPMVETGTSDSVFTKWWLWAVVGVVIVAAGGVTAGVVLTKAPSPAKIPCQTSWDATINHTCP